MKVSLELRAGGCTNFEVMIEAENPGEEAVLHLISGCTKLTTHRDSSIHDSYRLTKKLFIRPDYSEEQPHG